MKYNIWHIEMYHGWSDCDGPTDCNIKDDFIFDSRFSKREVIDMMVSMYDEDRCVDVFVCECIKCNQSLWLTDL